MEDFNRLIELLLPTFLRQSKIVAMLRVLIGNPLQRRHTDYSLFRANTRYGASITPQVCSLRHAIERKYDVQCEIKELDGRPYDFLVEIDRSADLNAIRGLLTKFSLAGKTFLFALGDTVYSAEWSNYVNENLITTYSADWINYVDERDRNVSITVYIERTIDIANQSITSRLIAISDEPVMSDITIKIFSYEEENIHNWTAWRVIDIKIPYGDDSAEVDINVTQEAFNRVILLLEYSPEKDNERNYFVYTSNLPPPTMSPIQLPPIYAGIKK